MKYLIDKISFKFLSCQVKNTKNQQLRIVNLFH